MPEHVAQPLLRSATVAAHDVHCRGECHHRSAVECAAPTHLVFPYRGLFMRHVGSTQTVADANHMLFFNGGEGYKSAIPQQAATLVFRFRFRSRCSGNPHPPPKAET